MYIIALKGREKEGAYSVEREGLKTLYLFLDKDDAIRYARLLEANDYPQTVSYTHLTLPTKRSV